MATVDESLFETPPAEVVALEKCVWYHAMNLPGYGEIHGAWDLRPSFDAYIGGVSVKGERVLELGPASGYVTMELERRGAEVVAAEVTDERGWDFVPQARLDMDAIKAERHAHIRDQKNTWWFVHRATNASAKAYYGDIEHLPEGLGTFDTTFMLAVLLHCRNPQAIVESAARLTTNRLVVTDIYFPELGELPVMKLIPTGDSAIWDTWWAFTPAFFKQLFGILGFARFDLTFHTQPHFGVDNHFFTLVAEKGDPEESPRAEVSAAQPVPQQAHTIVAPKKSTAARRLLTRVKRAL